MIQSPSQCSVQLSTGCGLELSAVLQIIYHWWENYLLALLEEGESLGESGSLLGTMVMAWYSAGHAAKQLREWPLGEATPDWLPDVYLVTEQRLGDEMMMGPEAAIGALA